MEEFDWNTQNECYLLESMSGHKPVGINKAFQMLCIYDKFKERTDKEVLSQVIWTHLGTMYNLEALDDNESLPFPNDEMEFELPDGEFAQLKESKLLQSEEEIKLEESLPISNIKEILKQDDKLLLNLIHNESQRRDSKDSRSSSTSSKKDKEIVKKGPSKNKTTKSNKNKETELSGKPTKRSTRGSLKADDSSSSGKSSPITVTPTPGKKRRVK